MTCTTSICVRLCCSVFICHTLAHIAWNVASGSPAWVTVSPTGGPVTARLQHSATVISGCMIVYGGRYTPLPTNTQIASDVWEYCPTPNTWTALSSSGPGQRYGHVAVTQSGRMMVFGGFSGNFPNDYLSTSSL